MLCVFWGYLSGLSTMKRAVTLIAAISLTLAGVSCPTSKLRQLTTFRLSLCCLVCSCLGLVLFGWWSRSAGRRMTDNELMPLHEENGHSVFHKYDPASRSCQSYEADGRLIMN